MSKRSSSFPGVSASDDFVTKKSFEAPLTGFRRGTHGDGNAAQWQSADATACVVADIENGKIMQLREYVDTAAAAEFSAALA